MIRNKPGFYTCLLLSCILILSCIFIVAVTLVRLGAFVYMRREPEIPVELLLEKQHAILGPEWTYTGGYLWTDSDATLGLWSAWMGFRHSKYEHFFEEIHVYSNSFWASIVRSPSPAAVNVEKHRTRTPEDWLYDPPHADWYSIDCEPVNSPDFCHYLVRYEEYIIYLASPITEYMTLDDLKEVVRVTDDWMYEYLKKSKLEEGSRGIPDQGELDLPIDYRTDVQQEG